MDIPCVVYWSTRTMTALLAMLTNGRMRFFELDFPPMATLTIRNLPDEVRQRLRMRAARAGRSMEAEVRAILCQASNEAAPTETPESLQAWVDSLYGQQKPSGVVDDLINERRREAAGE